MQHESKGEIERRYLPFRKVERMNSTFTYENKEYIFHHLENDLIAKSWKIGLFYELPLLEWIKNKNMSGTYVDVGSHQGNHLIYFSKVCNAEKVIGVEGSPYNFSFLEENVKLNKCDNVVLHNVIASNEFDVDTKLYYNEQNTGNTSKFNFGASTSFVSNTTDILDDLLKNEKVSLMKFDIQDMEWFALDGCINTLEEHLPILFIEWNDSNAHTKKITTLLNSFGYKHTDTFNVPSCIRVYEA